MAAADFCRRLQDVPFGSRNLLVASWLSRPATLQTLYCELQWTKRTAPRTTIFEPTIELLHPILAERSGSHDQRQVSNMPDRAAPQQKHALHRVCGVPNLAPPRTTVGLGRRASKRWRSIALSARRLQGGRERKRDVGTAKTMGATFSQLRQLGCADAGTGRCHWR